MRKRHYLGQDAIVPGAASKDAASPWPTAILTATGVAAVATLSMSLFEKWSARKAAKEAAVAGNETVSSVLQTLSPAGVRAALPKGAEFLADIAFEVAPAFDVNPLTILAITKHESNYGNALTPKGPGGTGDFIPRKPTSALQQAIARANFPVVATADGKLKPTARGWGHGLYQIDLASHLPFIATGKWADPKEAMKYALDLFTKNRRQIKAAFPNMGAADLLYASIAAYNAGAGGVLAALRAGVTANKLDQGNRFDRTTKQGTRVTYGANYVVNILDTQAKLRAAAGVA